MDCGLRLPVLPEVYISSATSSADGGGGSAARKKQHILISRQAVNIGSDDLDGTSHFRQHIFEQGSVLVFYKNDLCVAMLQCVGE